MVGRSGPVKGAQGHGDSRRKPLEPWWVGV